MTLLSLPCLQSLQCRQSRLPDPKDVRHNPVICFGRWPVSRGDASRGFKYTCVLWPGFPPGSHCSVILVPWSSPDSKPSQPWLIPRSMGKGETNVVCCKPLRFRGCYAALSQQQLTTRGWLQKYLGAIHVSPFVFYMNSMEAKITFLGKAGSAPSKTPH